MATTTTRPRSSRRRACCRPTLTSRGSSRRPPSASPPPPLPERFLVQGQGRADRAGHAQPDAQVREGRHRRLVRALGPGKLGYLAAYAAAALASGQITGKEGETFKAGNLGTKSIGADGEILLGPPQ